MKLQQLTYGLFFSFFALIGCEKVIDIPLDEAEQKVVVEAVVKSLEGESYVLLSKTIGSLDNGGDVERLSGASVSVESASGELFMFEEDAFIPGRYIHPSFAAEENRHYKLTVNYEGEMFRAASTALTVPQIDSLFVFQDTGQLSGSNDTTNTLIYTVTDNPDEKNFYRFVLWVNGVKDNTYFIETDDLGNGETYTSPFFGIEFDSGDSVYAELWSMDKTNYTYFSALYTNLNQSPFSAAPADPPTNLDNGAGYFGVFMVDTMSIIIP